MVAIGPQGPRTREDWIRAVSSVAWEARHGGRWLLALQDAFDFGAAVIGLAKAGATALIPPNFLPETLESLRPSCSGLLASPPEEGGPAPPNQPLRAGRVVFCTSGSTGAPKHVDRRFSELLDEVDLHRRALGPFPDGPVLGTVPHHHIYGFLFRILGPLIQGHPFITEAVTTPDRVLASLRAHRPTVLVSSPAHLAYLPQILPLGDTLPAPPVVVSSGGPLAEEDARRWLPWVPGGILEVFGSTETGGVAWRRRDASEASRTWIPFPDVNPSLAPDGALLVDTPRVQTRPCRMEDAADLLPDGRLILKGRLDRIVKVQEKRISLPELEEALKNHPLVQEAAVVPLQEPRTRLGAVVVLRPGIEAPDVQSLAAELSRHLRRRFEPAAIPRRWRILADLPRTDRGKVDMAQVLATFGTEQAPSGPRAPDDPPETSGTACFAPSKDLAP